MQMNLYKKQSVFVSLVCVLSLLFSAINIPVDAGDTNSVTASTEIRVRQGETASCDVYIDSSELLAALDITVYFDPSKVKIDCVYNSIGCTLYDEVVNGDNIQFSYILDGQVIETNTKLFQFTYQVLESAGVGGSYFDITIGEAYDKYLNTVEISGSRCNFKIDKTVMDKNCCIYGSNSVTTAIEEEFSLSYSFSTSKISSGSAVITYDSELFELIEVTNGAFLDEKIVDINKDLTGAIYISFVGTDYCSSTNLLNVRFRTVKNVTETSKIVFRTTELCDRELDYISCDNYTTDVNIAFDSNYTGDSPSMRLSGTFSYENKQISLVVSLEKNSKLGAGDFVISFDSALVSYNSCVKEFSPSFFNINDKNVKNGELKFSIISLSDIVTDEKVLTVVFDVNQPYHCAATDFKLDGNGLTDSLTDSISLNFVDTSVQFEYQITFCDENGEVLKSAIYHYGETVQEVDAPVKKSDMIGSYTFAGWDRPVTVCTADVIYTAIYTVEYTNYTVVFQNWDGSELSKKIYHYGDTVTIPPEPQRPEDGDYTYIFATWDREVTSCMGNITYTAVYTSVCKILYGDVNGDGKINIQDAVKLKKYLDNFNYDTETCVVEISAGADANGDGIVNEQDVVCINRYLANYDYDTGTPTVVLGPQGS